ncbi:MAG: HD domain-containing protein [Epsilonproteobacteria bacterium]|nr:HD domain-containing protein [Campylobacterota bacterium]
MTALLNRLRLFHKINLTFYISFVLVLFLIFFFYNTSRYMVTSIERSYEKRIRMLEYTDTIKKSLRRLDYMAVKNALEGVKDFKRKSEEQRRILLNNLEMLKRNPVFIHNRDIVREIDRIRNRMIGYKSIAESLKEEVQDDPEDGMYAILALAKTSRIISSELADLERKIDYYCRLEIERTHEEIMQTRLLAFGFVMLIFWLMYRLNRRVADMILEKVQKLHKLISSFLEVLSRKKGAVEHVSFASNDEIATIGKLIESNLHLAEEIIAKEREEAHRIEEEVKKATAEIRALNKEIEATQREVVFTMGAIAEKRSKETGYHVKRVAEYSMILARLYGLSLEESLRLKDASPMHDIGKLGIPDAILNKPGKLTDEEFEIIKTHTKIGYEMLKHSERPILKTAAIVAHEHHERWDGKGYPRGLRGEEIHIYGRITAVADVFDALGSDRVYKKAWPLEKIINLFKEERGRQFDPELVDLFLDNLEHFLAAKTNIEKEGDNMALSRYIENFERVDEYIGKKRKGEV